MSYMGFKAGMTNDREKINQIIYEKSKDSKFFLNQQKKDQKTDVRIAEMQEQLKTVKNEDPEIERLINRQMTELELTRSLTQCWLHCDMDAFFASVEIRDNPDLVGKPVAVGGMGMISTSSYEARKYGVRSAMPGFIGRELCPDLIFVSPNYKKYQEASELTRIIYKSYDPHAEFTSIDEACLNITDHLNKTGANWEEVVLEIKERILKDTQLTCSIGIAPNKILAKLGTEVNKPNGYYRITPTRESVMEFVAKLPIGKVNGIGRVSERTLKSLGIETVQDVLTKRVILYQLLSKRFFDFLLRTGLGIGGEEYRETRERKSISMQRTFRNSSNKDFFLKKLKEMAQEVYSEMREKNYEARCVTLITKSTAFESKTKAKTLPRPVTDANEIYETVSQLLTASLPLELRLIGIRLSDFMHEDKEHGLGKKNGSFDLKNYFSGGHHPKKATVNQNRALIKKAPPSPSSVIVISSPTVSPKKDDGVLCADDDDSRSSEQEECLETTDGGGGEVSLKRKRKDCDSESNECEVEFNDVDNSDLFEDDDDALIDYDDDIGDEEYSNDDFDLIHAPSAQPVEDIAQCAEYDERDEEQNEIDIGGVTECEQKKIRNSPEYILIHSQMPDSTCDGLGKMGLRRNSSSSLDSEIIDLDSFDGDSERKKSSAPKKGSFSISGLESNNNNNNGNRTNNNSGASNLKKQKREPQKCPQKAIYNFFPIKLSK